MAVSKAHLAVPPEKFNNSGVSVPRLAIKSEVLLIDLLDDLTGNVITHYNSAGALVAAEPDVESVTPDRRDSAGNDYIEWNGQTDSGEYLKIAFAVPQNWSAYNYLGLWAQSDTTTIVTDYDLELLDINGDLIASFNVPALTAGVWQALEFDISSHIRSSIGYIKIQCDVADNDVIDLFNLIVYEYGTGKGPANGLCGEYITTEILAVGDYVSFIPGRPGYVKKGANNATDIIGVCIKAAAVDAKTLVQETGRLYLRSAGVITINDPCSAASATTADNDTTAGRPFGTWLEATGTAGADLLVELNTRSGVGTTVAVTQLDSYAQGSVIRGGAADWEAHNSKTNHFILVGDGTDVSSKAFDWDDVGAGAGADMVHDHSAVGEGGEVPVGSLGSYVRGGIVRGGAVNYDVLNAETAGFILVGNGTDIISKQFDWDDMSAGAGSDMVHDHTSAAEGGAISLIQTDYQYTPDFLTGWAESGTWTRGFALSLPTVTRTPANGTTEVYQVGITIPSRSTASKGAKITSVKVAYSCDAADVGDDIQARLCKRTIPADNAAPGVFSVIAGAADGDYDVDHNTSAKRTDDTGIPENHTLTMTVGGGAQAFIANGEKWFLQLYVVEAADATGNLAIVIKDIIVYYTYDVN